MNIQMRALEIENIMRRCFPSYANQASIIRKVPYEEMKNFLQKLANENSNLKQKTEMFLVKNRELENYSLDKAYEEGFDIDSIINGLEDIVDIALANEQ